MKASSAQSLAPDPAWPAAEEKDRLIDVSAYDRSPALYRHEVQHLAKLVPRIGRRLPWLEDALEGLARLQQPIMDVMAATHASLQSRRSALAVFLFEMHQRQSSYWAWKNDGWCEILCASRTAFRRRYHGFAELVRHPTLAVAYMLGCFEDLNALGSIHHLPLARELFGKHAVDHAIQRVLDALMAWGYGPQRAHELQRTIAAVLLANRSPRLEDLTVPFLERQRAASHGYRREHLLPLSKALAGLGITDRALDQAEAGNRNMGDACNGVHAEWVAWVKRWRDTSTLSPKVRHHHYVVILKAGRWATTLHPDCVSPAQWTREVTAQWVAAVCRITVGEWTQVDKKYQKRRGQPVSARCKAHHLSSLSTFFRDLQEWGWIPRRFDPRRCFATPRSVAALIGPKPRPITDDVWAKLLWAGLNLAEADLPVPRCHTRHFYPPSMVRAVTIVWLFSGLRMDEIRRLQLGCTWRQWSQTPPISGVCDLHVPVNKTSLAFTKPVDTIVGDAVRVWESERPEQPPLLDEKTGELVHFLFVFRCRQIAKHYINKTLVPVLCRKAGIPNSDIRGKITTHRARSTIASQLFNAKEPMSLLELQKWLGHKWANSTQYYLDISPAKMAQSYRDAGYFARNVRSIEVLIDRESVLAGTAANQPWMFYDLGHGYCAYDFFDRCPHRMACAKCPYYRPKSSSKIQILEGKQNLLRLRQEIPLRDDELAAVEDGLSAFEKLLGTLADVPTPAGPTPRQLRAAALVQIEITPTEVCSGKRGDEN